MHKLNNIYKIILYFVFLASFLATSCATDKKRPDFSSQLRRPDSQLVKIEELQEDFVRANYYIIGEGDTLSIDVWKSLGANEGEEEKEYLIHQGDTLEISVWQWPELVKTAIVRPDGKISFPLAGDIDAKGKTLTELDNEITEKLSTFIKSPEVSVMITGFGIAQSGLTPEISFVKIAELSSDETVAPDGNIYLSLAGAVQSSGLTLNQLKHRIKEKVSDYVKDAEVSISIKGFGGKKILVLGEVDDPGMYLPTGEVNVLEAISLAGGYTRDAVLRNVLVIRGELSNPEVLTLNILSALKGKDMSQNIIVKPKDIVYVPRKVIAELNYFLTQILTPLTSSSSAVTAIKTIRARPSPKK